MIWDVCFWENYSRYPNCPNSKVSNCLKEEFHIEYDQTWERYKIIVPDWATKRATDYFDSIGAVRGENGRYNVLVLHYEGNTSQHKKNMHRHQAHAICSYARDLGLLPVILDWDNRSPLPDQKTIFCPAPKKPHEGPDLWDNIGTGNAAVITALITQASLYIGVDSGPGKCASATETPTLICWMQMHPMQFHDPAPNTVHLVPDTHESMPPLNDAPEVRQTFKNCYHFRTYETTHNGEHALVEQVMHWMLETMTESPVPPPPEKNGMTYRWGFWMPRFHDLFCFWTVIEDVYKEDGYKTAQRPPGGPGEIVVDVGANIGTFSRLWHERNPEARIFALEVNQKLLPALRENIGEYATVIGKACYYSHGDPLWLLDCMVPGSRNVGDSRIIDWAGLQRGFPQWYERTEEKVVAMGLEELRAVHRLPYIDVLKLDCEGSEYNILRNCDLSRIHTIFLESHDPDQLRELLHAKFRLWDVGHMKREGLTEIMHLVNYQWPPKGE